MTIRPNDSATTGYSPKASIDDPVAYKVKTAEPSMKAVDGLPAEFRALVYEYGYVDVYRAWKRGISPETIRARAVGGKFEL